MAEQKESGFKDLLNNLMQKRWYVTAIILGIFILITLGLFAGIVTNTPLAGSWKEILLLLLGVFSGSFNKIVDYYYSNDSKDTLLVAKMDEENDTPEMLMAKMEKGISSGDLKLTERVPTSIEPLVLPTTEFKNEVEVVESLPKVEEKQTKVGVEIDEDGDGVMDGLDFDGDGKIDEYFKHRQCEHVWGDLDGDGEEECLKCGKIKDEDAEMAG